MGHFDPQKTMKVAQNFFHRRPQERFDAFEVNEVTVRLRLRNLMVQPKMFLGPRETKI